MLNCLPDSAYNEVRNEDVQMTSVILLRNAMDEASMKLISEMLQNCGISFDIRESSNTIVVDGNNDVIRKAKQLICDCGYDVM